MIGKIGAVVVALLLLTVVPATADGRAVGRGDQAQAKAASTKVSVCHRTGSATHPWVLISISQNAWPAHQKHGDFLAGPNHPCPPPTTTTPGTTGGTATLAVCKVAGTGIAVGAPHSFLVTVAGQPARTVTVAAGSAPAGTCADAGAIPVNVAVSIQETVPAGEQVIAITCSAGISCTAQSLTGASVSATAPVASAGSFQVVTFTDAHL